MPIPRYEREAQRVAHPTFARALLIAYGVAALVGLLVGIVWVIAGVLQFHLAQ
jgi:hypothetical protein